MTEDLTKQGRFFRDDDGELYLRAVNESGLAMWFNLRQGLTSKEDDARLEAAFKKYEDLP